MGILPPVPMLNAGMLRRGEARCCPMLESLRYDWQRVVSLTGSFCSQWQGGEGVSSGYGGEKWRIHNHGGTTTSACILSSVFYTHAPTPSNLDL